ncbi:MAG TPA: hypothetical protein VKD69_21485 [Vicinamibacterales bacterium]|nr:hypothetical protein [Vicinamibacterales bacterium]
MDAPERFDQLIAFLESNLPSPVERQEAGDGSMTFTAGEPAEVVVSLTDSSVVVSEFAGVWESPFTLAARPRRVGVLKWRRLPETPLFNALSALIKGAREARHSRFQPCRFCGNRTAPEWMHPDGICQSCADQHSGAVH